MGKSYFDENNFNSMTIRIERIENVLAESYRKWINELNFADEIGSLKLFFNKIYSTLTQFWFECAYSKWWALNVLRIKMGESAWQCQMAYSNTKSGNGGEITDFVHRSKTLNLKALKQPKQSYNELLHEKKVRSWLLGITFIFLQ